MECYRESISHSTGHAGAHYQLGLMLLRSADFSNAEEHLQRAASLGISSAHYYLGLIYFYNDRLLDAQNHYQKISLDDPLAVAAICGLSRIALREGRWAEH